MNAPNQSMKEKYEQEMKKEIKKLQRIRDYFRQALGNPEVKDKSKADEARKRVEQVSEKEGGKWRLMNLIQEMENFRELEKELKRKQFSKKSL